MSKTKKIFISILVCFAIVDIVLQLLFAVWNNKTAITIEDLKKVAEQNGYEFVETDFYGKRLQKSGVIIIEKDVILEYWWFETNVEAEKKILEEKKRSGENIKSKLNVTFEARDYDKIYTKGGEKQQLLVRVDNTVLKSTYDMKKRKSIHQFIKQIRY